MPIPMKLQWDSKKMCPSPNSHLQGASANLAVTWSKKIKSLKSPKTPNYMVIVLVTWSGCCCWLASSSPLFPRIPLNGARFSNRSAINWIHHVGLKAQNRGLDENFKKTQNIVLKRASRWKICPSELNL